MCTCDFGEGLRTCHCSVCHETFSSLNSYDWHQKVFYPYGLVCLDPEMIVRKDGTRVLFRNRNGHWAEHRPDRPYPWRDVRNREAAATGARG